MMPTVKVLAFIISPAIAAAMIGVIIARRSLPIDQRRYTDEVAESPEQVNPLEKPIHTEFEFPRSSCGDPSESGDEWYPVFIDNADLGKIKTQYCADAISSTREETGKPTVQLASFTAFQEAQKFADAVGGEVGNPYTVGDNLDESRPEKATPDSAPLPIANSWQAPEGYDYIQSKEGVPMGFRRINQGYGCDGSDPVCITYEIVSSERCESISAHVAFLNKYGARLDSDFGIENSVPSDQQIHFSFGVRDSLVPIVKDIEFSELSCFQS